MSRRLDGKVAIITGAARGQGAAEARLFAAEGARVVLADVLDDEGAAVAAEIGDAARYVHLDVTDEDQWAAAVTAAEEAFGPVSVLVNNAGVLHFQSLWKTTLEDFDRVMRVNVTGVFLGMKAVVASMEAAGGGSIVNIVLDRRPAGPAVPRRVRRQQVGGAGPVQDRGHRPRPQGHPGQLGPPRRHRHADGGGHLAGRPVLQAAAGAPHGVGRRGGGGRAVPGLATRPPTSPVPSSPSTAAPPAVTSAS